MNHAIKKSPFYIPDIDENIYQVYTMMTTTIRTMTTVDSGSTIGVLALRESQAIARNSFVAIVNSRYLIAMTF